MRKELEMTAYAATIEINAKRDITSDKWIKTLKCFFNKLTNESYKHGAKVIGHVKGFLDLQGAGYCYFSNTGGSQKTKVLNKIKGDARRGKITFNAIVYGLEKPSIEKIVNSTTEIIKRELNCTCIINTKDAN